MGHCGRAIGALHAHAVRDGVDFPALDGRLALGGADKSRDARLGCQRFVCVVALVRGYLYMRSPCSLPGVCERTLWHDPRACKDSRCQQQS
jgi:hypothetical protein